MSRAISSLRLTPVLFELGARPHPPRELYRAYLTQSDIFIGIYGQQYGWTAPDMDISGLEDEFRLGHSMPRLLYIKSPAPDREPRLTAMIAEIEQQATASYRTFTNTRELGRLVRDDLALLLSERFTNTIVGALHSPSSEPTLNRRGTRSLPVPSTSLIGREHDIVEVAKLLDTPADANEHAEPSTIPLTFSLVACAELALTEGDDARAATALGAVDGLRRRAGLRAGP